MSKVLGTQQRPKQVDQQKAGDGTAEDQLKHLGRSDAFAGGGIGRERREDAARQDEQKKVKHEGSVQASGPGFGSCSLMGVRRHTRRREGRKSAVKARDTGDGRYGRRTVIGFYQPAPPSTDHECWRRSVCAPPFALSRRSHLETSSNPAPRRNTLPIAK